MTDKQEVFEALSGMPENVSGGEIIEELRIMCAARKGRPIWLPDDSKHKRTLND